MSVRPIFFLLGQWLTGSHVCYNSVLTKPVLERSLRNMLVMADDRKKAEDAAHAVEAAAAGSSS